MKRTVKRKTLFTIIMLLLICFSTVGFAGASTSSDVKVTLNGEQITFDPPPLIEDGLTLVPLRAICETLGALVEWDETSRTVWVFTDTARISLRIGSSIVYKSGTPISLDIPAKIVKDRTMVPLRFVSEALGAKVDRESTISSSNVTIVYPTDTYASGSNSIEDSLMGKIKLLDKKDFIISQLGNPLNTQEYAGVSKAIIIRYDGLDVFIDAATQEVNSVYVLSPQISSKRGIKIGSSVEEIEKLYGKYNGLGMENGEGSMRYQFDGDQGFKIIFLIKEGKVIAMETYLKGHNPGVNP